jgi:thymidylate synthase
MRACDVFTKLGADLAIFSSVTEEVADALEIPVAALDLIIDCGHIYKKDLNQAELLLEILNHDSN